MCLLSKRTLHVRKNLDWIAIWKSEIFSSGRKRESAKLNHITSTSIFLLWENGICSTSPSDHFLTTEYTQQILNANTTARLEIAFYFPLDGKQLVPFYIVKERICSNQLHFCIFFPVFLPLCCMHVNQRDLNYDCSSLHTTSTSFP